MSEKPYVAPEPEPDPEEPAEVFRPEPEEEVDVMFPVETASEETLAEFKARMNIVSRNRRKIHRNNRSISIGKNAEHVGEWQRQNMCKCCAPGTTVAENR